MASRRLDFSASTLFNEQNFKISHLLFACDIGFCADGSSVPEMSVRDESFSVIVGSGIDKLRHSLNSFPLL